MLFRKVSIKPREEFALKVHNAVWVIGEMLANVAETQVGPGRLDNLRTDSAKGFFYGNSHTPPNEEYSKLLAESLYAAQEIGINLTSIIKDAHRFSTRIVPYNDNDVYSHVILKIRDESVEYAKRNQMKGISAMDAELIVRELAERASARAMLRNTLILKVAEEHHHRFAEALWNERGGISFFTLGSGTTDDPLEQIIKGESISDELQAIYIVDSLRNSTKVVVNIRNGAVVQNRED